MAIVLDHTIVPAHDKEASARFLARILGLRYEGPLWHFAPLRINDTLTLDFDNDDDFDKHHYAFHVSDPEFDAIFGRVQGGFHQNASPLRIPAFDGITPKRHLRSHVLTEHSAFAPLPGLKTAIAE